MILKRSVKAIERYYRIDLTQNLFGEWIVLRRYGSKRFIKPTGEIMKIFQSREIAQSTIDKLVRLKMKKGYSERNTGQGRHTYIDDI
ncbi:MAG: WGR domain-containing protein [Sulfuricurvum sp.]|nr:WGR domain-containing protein [Sulfuricurvum sp.]